MKLKHGVLWNSQTGEAVGLADDMLDLKSIFKQLLSDEGNVVKPAEYVNCWRYIAIHADGTEGWMCGFFYNDGSLTSDTLLCQFDYVVLCCESINAKVYGLLKATRNQLFSSQPNGSKNFVDKYGNNFGWAFIIKINSRLNLLNESSPVKKDVRLNNKVANPTSFRNMDMSITKITTEELHKMAMSRIANNPPILILQCSSIFSRPSFKIQLKRLKSHSMMASQMIC